MPSSIKKGSNMSNKSPKKETILLKSIDLDRLFDTLYDYCRYRHREDLTERALKEYQTQGRGFFVVDPFLKNPLRVNSNVENLYSRLEWWNHERCVQEKMPECLPNDPYHHDPETLDFMCNRLKIKEEFVVAMVKYQPQINNGYGTRASTIALWRGDDATYAMSATINPYEEIDDIGETIEARGVVCAAEDCDNMEGKYTVATDCTDCGATKESCFCTTIFKVNTLPGGLQKCSGCQQVSYCSRECQLRDWTARHRAVCKRNLVQVAKENTPTDNTAKRVDSKVSAKLFKDQRNVIA